MSNISCKRELKMSKHDSSKGKVANWAQTARRRNPDIPYSFDEERKALASFHKERLQKIKEMIPEDMNEVAETCFTMRDDNQILSQSPIDGPPVATMVSARDIQVLDDDSDISDLEDVMVY